MATRSAVKCEKLNYQPSISAQNSQSQWASTRLSGYGWEMLQYLPVKASEAQMMDLLLHLQDNMANHKELQ